MKPRDVAILAAQTIDGKKGEDIRIVDVRKVSPITDFVVIASATSMPHLRGLRAEVAKVLREKASEDIRREAGDPESAWLVMDYFNVIIHLFLPEARTYYDIEMLWEKGRNVNTWRTGE